MPGLRGNVADRLLHLCRVRKVEQAEVEVAGAEVVVQQAAEAAVGPEAQKSDALLFCCQPHDVLPLFSCCWQQELIHCCIHV